MSFATLFRKSKLVALPPHQVIATSESKRALGEWGLKHVVGRVKAPCLVVKELDSQIRIGHIRNGYTDISRRKRLLELFPSPSNEFPLPQRNASPLASSVFQEKPRRLDLMNETEFRAVLRKAKLHRRELLRLIQNEENWLEKLGFALGPEEGNSRFVHPPSYLTSQNEHPTTKARGFLLSRMANGQMAVGIGGCIGHLSTKKQFNFDANTPQTFIITETKWMDDGNVTFTADIELTAAARKRRLYNPETGMARRRE